MSIFPREGSKNPEQVGRRNWYLSKNTYNARDELSKIFLSNVSFCEYIMGMALYLLMLILRTGTVFSLEKIAPSELIYIATAVTIMKCTLDSLVRIEKKPI